MTEEQFKQFLTDFYSKTLEDNKKDLLAGLRVIADLGWLLVEKGTISAAEYKQLFEGGNKENGQQRQDANKD